MGPPLQDGTSTPRYALVWILGVLVGSVIRFGLWLLPSSLVRRAMERVLP